MLTMLLRLGDHLCGRYDCDSPAERGTRNGGRERPQRVPFTREMYIVTHFAR